MKNNILFVFLFLFLSVFSQDDNTEKSKERNTEEIKKGYSFGGIPIIAFDEDTGLKYGGLVNLFHYGDGSHYPNYNHSLLLQWYKSTKGSGTTLLNYDALTLIPKTRVTLTVAYITEQALNFYGFNGYNANYNTNFENDASLEYISRVYYRYSRKLFTSSIDFQGKIKDKNLRWFAGLGHCRTQLASVDIPKLNEDLESDRLLPDTDLLYDKYVKWGIISEGQKNGGNTTLLKLGGVYDTRDNEANPNKGFWSEALVYTAPGILGNESPYTKLLITHRHYLEVVPEKLNFAYRLSYQTKIAGDIPFYMLPYMTDSKATVNGLGGSKNLRGILRNRIVGDGVAFGNFELRSKLFKSVILNQNFYLGISVFTDMGMVTLPYSFQTPDLSAEDITQSDIDALNYKPETLHVSYGGGLHFVINNNFVISADYGVAVRDDDGNKGLYIGVNYLF